MSAVIEREYVMIVIHFVQYGQNNKKYWKEKW